jgi:outer membrane protein assembly factor BamB
VDEDAVYSTDDRSHVWAIDRNNGATLWKQDKLQARSVTRPVIFKDYLIVGDYAGYLHVMSKSDGRFLARIQVDEEGILVPPMVHNDHILVLSRDGLLESYTLEDVVEYSFEEEADF